MPTENRAVRGVLGEKLGMTQVFDDRNRIVPVTVVKAGPCVVTQVRTPDKDGYSAVQLAYGAIDPRKVNKPKSGQFAKAGVSRCVGATPIARAGVGVAPDVRATRS